MEANALYEQVLGHVPIRTINSVWFQHFLHPEYRGNGGVAKRLVDVVVVGLASVVVLPLVALGALFVRLGDSGPAFYRQRRVGEGGASFDMIKMRTMRCDAEADGEPLWWKPGDSRTTAVGRFLRATHLDELPQCWNVLQGEMTLIGPRPERPMIVNRLEQTIPHYERRHMARPGVTGWAQVRCGYAGSDGGSAWKLSHDLYYLKNRSVVLDLLVCVETVSALFLQARGRIQEPSEQFVLGMTSPAPEGPRAPA